MEFDRCNNVYKRSFKQVHTKANLQKQRKNNNKTFVIKKPINPIK